MTLPPLLWVVGDSWSDPVFDGTALSGWPWLVADRLGLGLRNSAQGGAGFAHVNGGGWTFPVEVARYAGPADVVVCFGSINDSDQAPATVADAAVATFTALHRAAPAAELLVLGPQYPGTPDAGQLATLTALAGAIRPAAAVAGGVFVDALTWMTDRPDLIGPDNHPNPAGHAHLADLIAPLVAGLLAASRGAAPADGPASWAGFPFTFPAA